MRLWTLLAAGHLATGLLLTVQGAASAQESPPCSASAAKAAEVRDVLARIARWEGRCVRLTGIAANGRLYADRAALAEVVPYERVRFPEARTEGSILLYPGPKGLMEAAPARVEIIDRIGNCATAHDLVAAQKPATDGRKLVLRGYCQVSRARYLRVTTMRTVDQNVPRLRESEVPQDQRQLVDAPADGPGRARYLAAARALAVALQTRDEKSFLALKEGVMPFPVIRPAKQPQEEQALTQQFLALSAPTSPFANLPPVPIRQERVFVNRALLQFVEAEGRGGKSPMVVCWCRGGDCTGKWPVTARDADNDPSRPYACVRTFDIPVRGAVEPVAGVEAELPRFPFGEPDWSDTGGANKPAERD